MRFMRRGSLRRRWSTLSTAFISTRARANSRPRGRSSHQPADEGPQPVRHAAQGQPACRALGVGEEALHRPVPPSGALRRGRHHLVAEEREHPRAPLVAHEDPLVAGAAHVADGDVCEDVRVVDASATRQGEEIRRQLRNRQLQEGHGASPAIRVAKLHVIIGPELQIRDRRGIVGEQRQELMEPLRRRVVGARRADDEHVFEAEFGLDRAQGVHLAGNADDRNAAVPAARAGSSRASSGAKPIRMPRQAAMSSAR